MDPIVIRFRNCACPGTPHEEGDTVTLRPRLDFTANADALKAILRAGGDVSAAWEVYLFNGPEAWNLLDPDGRPLALTREALEALPFEDQFEIADQADTTYGAQVAAPLVRRMKGSSPTSPTPAGSRRRSSSSRSTPKRPARS